MSLFGTKSLDEMETSRLANEVRGLKDRLSKLLGSLEDRVEATTLTAEVEKLTRDLTEKQIAWDREKEKWDREKREVEHMVGLQRKRGEQERDLAVKAAKLEVREGNLSSKEEMFEERLEKVTEQLKEQVEYLRTDIIKAILERLPIFNVDTALEPHRMLTGGGNGKHHKGDDD